MEETIYKESLIVTNPQKMIHYFILFILYTYIWSVNSSENISLSSSGHILYKLCVCVCCLWSFLTWHPFKARGRTSGVWCGWAVPAGKSADQSLPCPVAAGRWGGRTLVSYCLVSLGRRSRTTWFRGSCTLSLTCSWSALWAVFVFRFTGLITQPAAVAQWE